jgi:HlyD family secretion protein
LGKSGRFLALFGALALVDGGAGIAAARTITTSGMLRPVGEVTVGSNVSGMVLTVTCEANATVKKGQSCAKIDPRPFEIAVENSRASIAMATAQLESDTASLTNIRAHFTRSSTLSQQGWTPRDQLEDVQTAYARAEARIDLDKAAVEQRKAELAQAELNLEYTNILSPMDGVVLERKVGEGETVVASFKTPSLFIIASDLSQLKLAARIAEGDVGSIKVGDSVAFTVQAFPTRKFSGHISVIGNNPVTENKMVTFEFVVDVDNKDLTLKPGMTAQVAIDTNAP